MDLWRPRSCYIYIARKCLKSPNYKPWNDFSFDDYLQRQHLMKTFETRHLPVLRGEVDIPLKYLPDPDCWTVDSESDTPVKKKRKSAKTKSPSHCKHVQRKLMWDFELEKWVPNEMGTQAPPRSTVALRDPQLKERKRRKKKGNEEEGRLLLHHLQNQMPVWIVSQVSLIMEVLLRSRGIVHSG